MVRKNYGLDALANLAKEYLIISTLVEEIRSSNQMKGIYSTRKYKRTRACPEASGGLSSYTSDGWLSGL